MSNSNHIPTQIWEFLRAVSGTTQFEIRRYVIVVAVFFVAWWWLRHYPGTRNKLQPQNSAQKQIRREIIYSLISTVVFGSVMPILFAIGAGRYMRFYPHVEDYGWAYFFISIVLMVIIQDTYFYWTHRLMHHRRLFRYFHRVHHLSTNPNPWTTYSMNPLDAVVNSGAFVTTLYLIPTTGLALFIFSWINLAYAVYGHLGYEILPAGTAQHWLGQWINTSVAHNMHHARARYNFGWYFLFWDRWMNTLAPDYVQCYAASRTSDRREPDAIVPSTE
jgi:Delta7-sterol 5-desaturase